MLRECKPLPRHLNSSKSDAGFESRFLDLDPDVCWIAAKMLIHYLVGISYFASCRENLPVTIWEMLTNLLNSLIPHWWGKSKCDPESVGEIIIIFLKIKRSDVFFLFKSVFPYLWFSKMCNWFLLYKFIRTCHVQLKCKKMWLNVANLLPYFLLTKNNKTGNRRKVPSCNDVNICDIISWFRTYIFVILTRSFETV